MDLDPLHIRQIYRHTYRVTTQATCPDGRQVSWSGTAFCFGMWREVQRPILATAKHVLDFPSNSEITMKFERFDEEDQLVDTVTLNCQSEAPDRPYGTYNYSDIGFIHLPDTSDDGSPLISDEEALLKVIPTDRRFTAGSWVGWAGFAEQVESFVGRKQLCFFQGTISAFGRRTDRDGHAYYIVDGHAARGVSGGPVWGFNSNQALQVAGIVSAFRGEPGNTVEPVIPGYCCFEPINPLVAFAETKFKGI